jgi:hypothetical protein
MWLWKIIGLGQKNDFALTLCLISSPIFHYTQSLVQEDFINWGG